MRYSIFILWDWTPIPGHIKLEPGISYLGSPCGTRGSTLRAPVPSPLPAGGDTKVITPNAVHRHNNTWDWGRGSVISNYSRIWVSPPHSRAGDTQVHRLQDRLHSGTRDTRPAMSLPPVKNTNYRIFHHLRDKVHQTHSRS